VEVAKLTDATITHRAAIITLKLVNERGGDARANTQWSVLTPGGDVIKESIGAFPRVILAEGEYGWSPATTTRPMRASSGSSTASIARSRSSPAERSSSHRHLLRARCINGSARSRRNHSAAPRHVRGRGATRAAERSAGPRALPLRAVAARPLHAAGPAAQAAIALGLPHPRPRARKIAFAAKPGLLIRRAMARRLLCVVIRAGG